MTGRDQVCPPDHKHAETLSCYTAHKCGCQPCRDHNTDHARRVSRLKLYGRWDNGRTPLGAVRVHIMILQRFGYSHAQIARAAGIEARTVWRCMNDRSTWMRGRIAAAILSVAPTIDDLDPGTLIPATGAVRRVQALACLGWTGAAIATAAGLPRSTVRTFQREGRQITVAVHRAIDAAYERMWNQPAPAGTTIQRRDRTASIKRAAAGAWTPPLGWDDIDTDPEPQQGEDAGVDEIAIALAVDGQPVRLTREERHIALRELHRLGLFDPELSARLGVDVKTIERDRRFLGLPANYWNEHEAAA
ncbi:hypothetical protein ACLBWJ_13180 [Microbacterium sp. M4A5_1d]